MNFAIIVGVLIEKPIVRKVNSLNHTYFRVGVLGETSGEPTYINCCAKGKVGFNIYGKCTEGTPVVVRGAIAYNKEQKSNYIDVNYIEILIKAFDKEIKMGMKEFLDIYKPQNAIKEVKKIIKEQQEEEQKRREEIKACSHTESTSDMS